MVANWFVDPVNGNDSNAGTSWGLACATINGVTSKAMGSGDTARVAKTPDPQDIGQTATWASGSYQSSQWKSGSTQGVASSTNANPIVITTSVAHTLVTGDYVGINGHTTNTNANGCNQITVLSSTTFSIPVAGNGVGGATGTIYKTTIMTVTLSSPVTAVITNCDAAWTNGTSCVSTLDAQNTSKEGIGSAKFVITTPATSLKLAYFTIPSTNFSSYNQISFWLQNTAVITSGQYTLNLCSDTAGATVVNTVAIPAIPSTGQYVPFTIDTGGALGSAIQSIALYTGATTGTTNTLHLDHVIACGPSGNASSLSLTSLIGKNNGTEGWFCIRSINGTAIQLDHGSNSSYIASRGYYGVSESVELWRRETAKITMMTVTTSTTNSLQGANLSNKNNIIVSGGWNTSSGLQDGATYWDGQNGLGAGLHAPFAGAVSGLTITQMNFCRYYIAVGAYWGVWNTSSVTCFNITNCGNALLLMGNGNTFNINNTSFLTTDALSLLLVNGNIIQNTTINLTNIFAGNGSGIAFTAGNNNTINLTNYMVSFSGAGMSNTSATSYGNVIATTTGQIINCNPAISLSCAGTPISNFAISACATAISLSSTSGTIIKNCALSGNTTDFALNTNPGANYFVDGTYSVAPSFTGSVNETFFMRNPNSVTSAKCFSDNMTCQTDLATVHTSGNRSWNITTSRTNSNYPALLPLGYVAVQGNASNAIAVWVYYTSAAMICGLRVVGGQVEGMTSTVLATTTGTANTWQQVTLNITTPTQSGPVMLQAYALSSSGTQNAWFADLTVT